MKLILRQTPQHAESRKNLKELLANRQANGIIFTTMQKFEESNEALTERRNIIVMADEAHRGQYGLNEKVVVKQKDNGEVEAKTVIGTARIIRDTLPNATYIGFTGTPISTKDRSTREVFGDYIDIYDMTQAVEDGATRPVYYESRVIHLKLDENTLHLIDNEYDIMADNADPYVIEKSKKELGQMEAILGADQTINSLVNDILDHYENYRENMLNVAVSRAVHSLAVVTSQDPRNDQTNYGDLTRYIEYNNFEVIQSQVYSVFDMLYHGYAEQRRAYLQKHKRVSEYDSENLMYSVIQEVLSEEAFSSIGCAVHVSLATLVKNYEPLTEEERKYARNPLTHVDFLLFNQMDKQPMLAIEVDGTGFHEVGSKQAERDMKKNSILEKCAVPLLRLRTDGSGEKEKIKNALKRD